MPALLHHLTVETTTALEQRTDLSEWEVVAVATPDAVESACADAGTVLLLDCNAYNPQWQDSIAALEKSGTSCSVMLVFDKSRVETVSSLLSQAEVSHLLPASTVMNDEYFALTLAKLLGEKSFGVDHYLTQGLEPTREILSHTRQKYEQLEVFERFCELSGVTPRVAYAAVSVADELIMNAIYHAPSDENGVAKYTELPRNEPVSLEFSERVEFRYACDDERLIVAVTDRFGRLTLDTIQESLGRCMRGEANPLESPGQGAGLGLFSIYSNVNQLVFNILPGERTEVLVIWDITSTYKEMSASLSALNVFILP